MAANARCSTFSYNKTYRKLLFTLWKDKLPEDWTPPSDEELKAAGVRLFVTQQEICPQTGREHWQSYIALNKPFKPAKVMKLLKFSDKGAWHATPPDGSDQDNLTYCTKADTRVPNTEPRVFGKAVGQGQRTDLASACDSLADGGIKRVAEQHPTTFVKYHRGMRELQSLLYDKPRDRNIDPTIIVLWGPTGTGKTRDAFQIAEDSGKPYYVKMVNNKWWDGAFTAIAFVSTLTTMLQATKARRW